MLQTGSAGDALSAGLGQWFSNLAVAGVPDVEAFRMSTTRRRVLFLVIYFCLRIEGKKTVKV